MTPLYHQSQKLFLCCVCNQEKSQTERYYANRSRFILCKMCASQGKHCPLCVTYKAFSEFPPNPRNRKRGGVEVYCKLCTRMYVHQTYDPVQRRTHKLKNRFNLTQADYDAMFTQQGGVCAICKRPETAMDKTGKKIKALAVDHDHETGNVRQLLCNYCNYLLGYVKDNPDLLQAASEYLKRHQCCETST